MARRISWTNNSTNYSGSYVYRGATLDPQNLPAPVATVDPVVQGATSEWIDSEELPAGDYDYAVRDYDGSGEGGLSAVTVYTVEPSLDTAQIGDEIGGGVYAGTITYADAREFHIIAALQAGEGSNVKYGSADGSSEDADDGYANTQSMVSRGISNFPAGQHCVDYSADGNNDFYMPSKNELRLMYDNLMLAGHPEFSTATSDWRLSSTENGAQVWAKRFSDGDENSGFNAGFTGARVRPIRRVPV